MIVQTVCWLVPAMELSHSVKAGHEWRTGVDPEPDLSEGLRSREGSLSRRRWIRGSLDLTGTRGS